MCKKILILIVLICGCKEKTDKQTKILSTYLKQFKIAIPANLHYYVLIPRLGCKGCVEQALTTLDTLAKGHNDITIITSREESIISMYLKQPILFDSLGVLDAINLGIYNVTIVETAQGRINYIRPILIDETDTLKALIKAPTLSYQQAR